MVKQKTILTKNQMEEFIKNAKTIQEKLMIKCMLKLGFRVSELVNFKIEWINFIDKIVNIQLNHKPISWHPKYLSIREIPIPENLLIELNQFIGNKKKGYIFKSRKRSNHYRFNTDSIIRKINRISKKVLERNTGTHVFRRTYASYLSNSGHDLVQISKLLGHSDVKTTFLYLKDIPDRKNYDKTRNMEIMSL